MNRIIKSVTDEWDQCVFNTLVPQHTHTHTHIRSRHFTHPNWWFQRGQCLSIYRHTHTALNVVSGPGEVTAAGGLRFTPLRSIDVIGRVMYITMGRIWPIRAWRDRQCPLETFFIAFNLKKDHNCAQVVEGHMQRHQTEGISEENEIKNMTLVFEIQS